MCFPPAAPRTTCPKNYLPQENPSDRLRPAARLSEEAKTSRIRAELRTDRGDHRRRAAARGASRLMVGDPAQPAGEDAPARSLSRRRLHRDKAGGREERAVQANEGGEVGLPHNRRVVPRLVSSNPPGQAINSEALADVRFGAHYGRKSEIARGPESAKKRLMRRSKRRRYSITC